MISDEGPDNILETEAYTATLADGCVKLRIGSEDPEVVPISVPSLLEKAAKEAPEIVALAVKRDDKWIKWTYKEYLQGKCTYNKQNTLHPIFLSFSSLKKGESQGEFVVFQM